MTTIHFIALPNTFLVTMMILFSLSYMVSSSFAFVVLPTTTTTTMRNQQYPLRPSFSSSSSTKTTASSNCGLYASNSNSNDNNELFKAGLLADESSKELAIKLASTKIRKVSDLKIWKEKSNLKNKSSSIRPKYWSFGGNDELPIQDKANYSTDNPNCSEPWLGLQDFYSVIDNDTAAADIIFVSLAGGRAFIERDVAESVLNQWWNNDNNNSNKFDPISFEQTVKNGQRDFITSWSIYVGVIGIAGTGIAFPNNPIQLGLVHILDMLK
jgi:hypothetical protein